MVLNAALGLVRLSSGAGISNGCFTSWFGIKSNIKKAQPDPSDPCEGLKILYMYWCPPPGNNYLEKIKMFLQKTSLVSGTINKCNAMQMLSRCKGGIQGPYDTRPLGRREQNPHISSP